MYIIRKFVNLNDDGITLFVLFENGYLTGYDRFSVKIRNTAF